MPGMPAPPPMPGMQIPGLGQPAAKKQKTGALSNLVPEEQFATQVAQQITLHVMLPVDPDKAEWGFNGQTLDISMGIRDTVSQLKDKITEQCGMPGKKMKINFLNGAFLNKDSATLAFYNVRPDAQFQLGVRERGRRKK